MRKVIGFIISLIMIFSMVACMDDNPSSLPIYPDSSNSTTDTNGDSKEEELGDDTEVDDDESSDNDGDSGENKNNPPNKSEEWSGFY